MGKDLKAQTTHFPHFSWSQQNPGHQSPIWKGCQVSEPVSRGPACPRLRPVVAMEARWTPMARSRWERVADVLLSGQETQSPGSGPLPLVGSAQGLCSVDSGEAACPHKAGDGCTVPPHREGCVEGAVRMD